MGRMEVRWGGWRLGGEDGGEVREYGGEVERKEVRWGGW